MPKPIILLKRGILRLTGVDRKNFLQGLITNDINLLTPLHSLYSALLSPQGKFLHDFFLIEEGDAVLLDTQKDQIDALKKRLGLYKLRAQVTLEDVSDDYAVFALPDYQGGDAGQTEEWKGGIRFVDPRLSLLGARWVVKYIPKRFQKVDVIRQTHSESCAAYQQQQDPSSRTNPEGQHPHSLKDEGYKNICSDFLYQEDDETYELSRVKLGIPEAGKDMIADRSIPLEAGLQDLNAIGWTKGCYLGQELVARTKYRGEIRKRLLPVEIVISSPEDLEIIWSMRCEPRASSLSPKEISKATRDDTWQSPPCQATPRPDHSLRGEAPIIGENGDKVGELYSLQATSGIARLRLEDLQRPLFIGAIPLKPFIPSWIKL